MIVWSENFNKNSLMCTSSICYIEDAAYGYRYSVPVSSSILSPYLNVASDWRLT